MAKHFNYHADLKAEILQCPKCGWKGTLDEGAVELHHSLMDCSCPECDWLEAPMLAIVSYPSTSIQLSRGASAEHVKCLLWNLQWKLATSEAGGTLQSEIAKRSPDIMCLTEAVVSIVPQGHRIEADSDYGYDHDGSRRKVILWSKTPWDDVDILGDPEMLVGRFVTGVTQGIRLVGVCIPWRDAHVRTRRKNKKPWQDHLGYCAGLKRVLEHLSGDRQPICVLGDFNRRIPRARQPAHVFDALIDTKPPQFKIITEGVKDGDENFLIDHIAHSQGLAASSVEIMSRYGSDGRELSDHVGVYTCLMKT